MVNGISTTDIPNIIQEELMDVSNHAIKKSEES